jgi:hypothetical protein
LAQAVRDPALLGGVIEWYPRQLALLDSLDGPEQLWLGLLARQIGKTTLVGAKAVHNAALCPDLDAMLPSGRIRYVLVVAPGEAQAIEFVRVCAAFVEHSPLLRDLATIQRTRIDFELPREADGRRWVAKTAIASMPASGRTIRGYTSSLNIFEEFGYVADTAGPGSDEALWSALQPALRAFGKHAKTVVISTPNGRHGKLFELVEAAEGGVLKSATVHRGAVWDVVPGVDREWLEGQRVQLGEPLYQQEYGAAFVDAGGSFFDLSQVEFEDAPAAPADATNWTVAFDPAFHRDRFGCVLLGESASQPGEIVVGPVAAIDPKGAARSFEKRRAREDATLAAVWELVAPYRPERIVSDQHNAPAIRSYFERRGVPVQITNVTGPIQTAAFVATRARLVDGSLRCWRHAQLIEDLRRVRARDTEAIYLPRYGDSHCDAAAALALGVHTFAEQHYAPAAVESLGVYDPFSSGASLLGSEFGG